MLRIMWNIVNTLVHCSMSCISGHVTVLVALPIQTDFLLLFHTTERETTVTNLSVWQATTLVTYLIEASESKFVIVSHARHLFE